MERKYKSDQAKAIGASNFMVHHLEDILRDTKVVPSLNQVEFYPFLVQPDLISFRQSQNIQVEAWSPLMQGQIITEQAVQRLAEEYNKTPAQIVLGWDLQHEVVTIPKSVHFNRIDENAQIFDFEFPPFGLAGRLYLVKYSV